MSGYRFGVYLLDTQRHVLRRGDREVPIGERAYGVLELLVANAGEAVGKQELIETVWRDVAVTDDSLARAVSDLRAALDDDASHPRFIRTVHRHGYLFIASVEPFEGDEIAPGVTGRQRRRWLRSPIVPAVIVALVVASGLAIWNLRRTPEAETTRLPEDLSGWRLQL